jgi:hypothetical protein
MRPSAHADGYDFPWPFDELVPTTTLPTLGAECLLSGGKSTVFLRVLKVGT